MYLLSVRKISKWYETYSGRFFALKKVSVDFPNRGFIAIMGKSGSGKSTLLNILSGIERPDSGSIWLEGKKMGKGDSPILGRRSSIIFQHYNLINGLSVIDNIALPLSMRGMSKRAVSTLCRKLGISKLRKRKVDNLSGGEKQRVAIARALAISPSIVYADEPTGALDEGNSEIVMGYLKKISRKRLVIMVSHNKELVDKYADRVIEIRDGQITSDSGGEIEGEDKKAIVRKDKHRSFWIGKIIGLGLRKHFGKNLMCGFSSFIGFAALLLSVGFVLGNGPAMEEESAKVLHHLLAKASLEEEYEIPGSNLHLIKSVKPRQDDLEETLGDIKDFDIVNDYSYFFPSAIPFKHEEANHEAVNFTPIWDIGLGEYGEAWLKEGRLPESNDLVECVANTMFFDSQGWDILGGEIEVSVRFVVSWEGKKNERYIDKKLKVVGAVEEFGFLNIPRIYYSYRGLEEELERIRVEGDGDESISIKEMVDEANGDDAITSYSSLIFFHDPGEMGKVFAKIKDGEEDIKINSDSYALRESFSSLSQALTSSLLLFVGISFVSIISILGMSAYSSLVSERKTNAILLSLGARRGDIVGIYSLEVGTITLFSSALSLIISPLLQRFCNNLLYKEFDVSTLIRIPYESFFGVPFLLIWGTLLASILFGVLVSSIPIAVNAKHSICVELRDE